jgi:hypothetical protein
MEMDADLRPSPVPRPRVFTVVGIAPGPRCGHTLTAISGPEGDLSKAKLVLFGEIAVCCESGLLGDVADPAPAFRALRRCHRA